MSTGQMGMFLAKSLPSSAKHQCLVQVSLLCILTWLVFPAKSDLMDFNIQSTKIQRPRMHTLPIHNISRTIPRPATSLNT